MNNEMYRLFRSWCLKYVFVCNEVLDWLFCMAHLETGNFTSAIFKENFNLFGMKFPKCRVTTSCGFNRNHAYYSSYIDSIDDLVLWFCFNRFYQSDFLDLNQFVTKFAKTYYNPKMESYINSINKLYSKFFVK